MNLPENLHEITDVNSTPEMLLQTKLQIEKDLGLSGFAYSWQDTPKDLTTLVPELSDKLEQLRNSGSSDIMKIVYRVDLTEKQYKKVSNMPGEWYENMAKAIVLREFQKIVIRSKFK